LVVTPACVELTQNKTDVVYISIWICQMMNWGTIYISGSLIKILLSVFYRGTDAITYAIKFFMFYHFGGCHNKDQTPKEQRAHRHAVRLRQHEARLYGARFDDDKCIMNEIPMDVPHTENPYVNRERFDFLSRGRTEPVVLRGLISSTKACKLWNAQYFSEGEIGNASVLSLVPSRAQSELEYTSFAETIPLQRCTLKKNIHQMLNPTSVGIAYTNNVTSLFMDHPALINDLQLNTLCRVTESVDDTNWFKLNFFIGGAGTKTSMHCAAAGNFFHNIYGRKRWTLIHPKYSKFLGPIPSKDFAFVISEKTKIPSAIPRYEVVLNAGDVLYNAPFWWHRVENLDNFTIGVAVRDHQTYWQSWNNNPLFMAMSPYWYSLAPPVIWLATKIFGRDKIVRYSMESGTFVNRELSSGTH